MSLSITNQDPYIAKSSQYWYTPANNRQQTNNDVPVLNNTNTQSDSFVRQNASNQQANDKVSSKEALGLLCKGFVNKAVDIIKGVVTHPIKTVAALALTTGALFALPFVGVSVATGGAALVVGFGLMASVNTIRNTWKAYSNYKKDDNNELRKNLKDLGGNGFDLALTLPFLPKAISHLKRNVSPYFQPKIMITNDNNANTVTTMEKYFGGTKETTVDAAGKIVEVKKNSLFSQIMKEPTWEGKFKLLLQQDRRELFMSELNNAYRQTAKERGFVSPSDLECYNKPIEYTIKGKEVSTTANCGHVNTAVDASTPRLNTATLYIENPSSKSLNEMITSIGHEHRHVEQFSQIVRTEGMENALGEQCLSLQMHRDGVIKAGTPKAIEAEKFLEAHRNYTSASTSFETYTGNLLEVDASTIGEVEIAAQISKNLRTELGLKEAAELSINAMKPSYIKDTVLSNARTQNVI